MFKLSVSKITGLLRETEKNVIPVGFHMAYTGVKAFKEYGFKKLPKKYTVFYIGRVKYAYEVFLFYNFRMVSFLKTEGICFCGVIIC